MGYMEFNIKHFELSVREHWGLCNVHFFFLRKLTKYINVEEVTKSININRLGCVGGIFRITTSFITTSGLKKAAKRLTCLQA